MRRAFIGSRSRRDGRGFTLVEILAVVGVIAVLVAILLPVIGRAWAQAKTAVCASQLHQIYVASQSWRQEHTGAGNAAPALPTEGWRTALRPYLKVSAAYICPADTTIGSDDVAADAVADAAAGGKSTPPSPPTPQPPAAPIYTGGMVDGVNLYIDGVPVPFGPGPRATVVDEATGNSNLATRFGPQYGETLSFDGGAVVLNVTQCADGWVVVNVRTDTVKTFEVSLSSGGGMIIEQPWGGVSDARLPGHLNRLKRYDPPPAPDPTTGAGGGSTTPPAGTPGFPGESSYAVSAAVDRVNGAADKVFGIDYRISVADVVDDWRKAPFIGGGGRLLFARHADRANVLRGDGSVQLSEAVMPTLDPANAENVRRWWLP
jgi:prepilin-type N-terminal cleavage/methylation domain-containing protein/prepilin-type processing-associated H-X9-DG protein